MSKVQLYFISKLFNSAEIKYVQIEKYLYALVIAARKLRPYFHAHDITVLTNQPLKNFLMKPDSSGRMVKWTIELSEFNIKFAPKMAIKGQTLADFIVESTSNGQTEADNKPSPSADNNQIWELYTNGSSSREGSGAGLILIPPEGEPFKYAIALTFEATNNEAEYEALITGLRLEKVMGISSLNVKSDSELMVNQVNGTYEARGKI